VNAKLLLPALVIALASPVPADENLETAFRTTGAIVLAAFEPQRLVIQQSSAVIYDGLAEKAYGVVISPQGDILTKASEIKGIKKLAVTVDQKKYTEVKILTIDPTWDVAHLKVAAVGLTPVKYAPTSAVPQGTWVVANGVTSRTHRRVLAGIISAKTREVGGAALGVILKQPKGNAKENAKDGAKDDAKEGKEGPKDDPKDGAKEDAKDGAKEDAKEDANVLEIMELQDKSGAKEAGLQKGDVITAIGDQPVGKFEDIAKALKGRKVGTKVKVSYRRNNETASVEVRLMARSEMTEQMSRNDQMSGKVSDRRSDFPRVMQHDILSANSVVGGPLLDLDGRCLGMNIARANRAETFAIPVEDLKAIAEQMLRLAREAEGTQID
jgi:serine protease Do